MGEISDDEHRSRLFALWLQDVLEHQDGVATRAQLVQGGWSASAIRRAERRNELQRLHRGVYVTHNGPPTWRQRAWAAVLYAAPAALCWDSIEEPQGAARTGPIHVAIDRSRRVTPQDGILVHHLTGLRSRQYGGSPPRLRLEDNALAMCGDAESEIEVIAPLAEVARRRFVTGDTMAAALARFPTLRRRAFIASVVDDLVAGTHSVLEHGYLERVERAHGLPTGTRQAPRVAEGGSQFRDIEHAAYGLVVELDGRLNHGSWSAQGRDAERELDDLAARGGLTVRLHWKQVYETQCRTARRLGVILTRRGWQGALATCDPCQSRKA